MNNHKFYINGEWVDPISNDTASVENPATGEELTTVAMANNQDMERAVAAAKAAFPAFSRTSKEERIALLKKIAAAYEKRRDEVAQAMLEEGGFPKQLAFGAQAMIGTVHLEQMIETASKFDFDEMRDNVLVTKEAIGVVAMVTPWNWPINQIVCKVAPAIAAGCTMVLKPSEFTPLNALLVAEVMHEAGVPPGVFNLINADGPTVGSAMCAHNDVDMVSFTGSTRGGVSVAKVAADSVKRVHQELGGKSPFVLMPDSNLETAVGNAVGGCFLNAGQSCNAPTRLLVPKDLMGQVMEIAKAAADAQVVGNPEDEAAQIGPLINARQQKRVNDLIQSGIDEGATLATGGTGMPEGFNRGHYVRPTVFGNITPSMTLFREEVFGPVLSITGYDNFDHAAELANDTIYGLAGYIDAPDEKQGQEMARRIRAGTVYLNGESFNQTAPFGGFKMSGNGREYADFSLNDYLEIKGVVGWAA